LALSRHGGYGLYGRDFVSIVPRQRTEDVGASALLAVVSTLRLQHETLICKSVVKKLNLKDTSFFGT
jgi:hypothetical protein